jgi:DNA-binding winged helix-turn-helix (wHTH) protein/Tfp pilus assembly protein PilF
MLGRANRGSESLAMPATVSIGRLRFDLDSHVLYDGNEIVPLAPLPSRMLEELVRADGDVVAATWMRHALWGDAAVEDRNLNQQMYVLRRALRRDPRVAIENVPRRGYRLVIAPAPVLQPARRARSHWGVAAVVLAAVVLVPVTLSRIAQPEPAAEPVNRDLALANYLATSEGPDHLDQAARHYRVLISSAPNNGAGYGGLALVDAKIALGSVGTPRSHYFDEARMEAAAAIRRDANESDALTALGIIASVRDHRTDIATQMFDAAVAADPTAESPRAWRGKFRLSIGEFNEAGCDFRTVSKDAPTSGYAVGLLGEWLVLDRDYVNASAVLSQALDLGNHPGFARYWLARSYYMRGLDAQALQLSNQVLALYPGEASALALRLRVEESLGDTRAAAADLAQIEEIRDPNQVDPIALASADVAMGKRAQALKAIQRYESSDLSGLDEIARIRTDPDFDSLRSGFNTTVTL